LRVGLTQKKAMHSRWRQIESSAQLWGRGRQSLWLSLAGLVVAFHGFQWALQLIIPGELESWLGLSRYGIASGFLWQPLTYAFLHELLNPLSISITLLGLGLAGRELEMVLGARHLLFLVLSSTLVGGLAHLASSPVTLTLGAWPSVFGLALACTTMLPECTVTWPFRLRIPLEIKYKYIGWALVAALLVFLVIDQPISTYSSPFACLAGSAIGWVYVRRLGFGNPLLWQRWWWKRDAERRRLDRMPADQFVREQLDPVLEKIARRGIGSLSRAEKNILQQGRRKIFSGYREPR
jgi:rhomboid family protein